MNLTWKNFLAICLIAIAGLPAIAQTAQSDPYKPPRYWSTYEYNIALQHFGVCYNFIPEYALQANIDWVDQNLKPFGYDIIQIDGWGDSNELNQNGYRTTHSKFWHHDYAWWSTYLQSRGMQLGIYVNPLWIHVSPTDTSTKIVGTDINVSTLIDNSGNSGTSPTPPATGPSQTTASPNAANSCGLTGSSPSNTSFTWVDVNKPGAEQYVKGYVKFYADMGVKFIKVDFMAWYETGFDHYLGRVGPPHSHQDYVTAMRWIREACDENGVYFGLTMANLFNEAQVERQYAHSIRVDEDVDYGEWYKLSDKNRGQRFPLWSQWANAMDGFTYWSYLSGQNRVRLDGDFIRMNTYASDSERRTAISAHVLAGGLIGPTDQFNTIGNSVWVYQNRELLSLNADDFVAKPLTNNPTDQASQIWSGKTSNGDTILALFNRELNTTMRSVNFSDIGVPGNATVRDLWQHADLGQMSSVSVYLPPHGSIVLKLSNEASTCTPQSITFNPIGDWAYNQPPPAVSATASSGLPVQFEVAFGPAITQANQVQPTGQPGTVSVVAKQPGNKTICAAMPQVQSFEANGPHQDNMFLFGTFTNWTPVRMKLEGAVWVAHNLPISAGNQQLKFANTNNFTGTDWGGAQGLSGTATVTTGGKPDLQINSPESAYYMATFDDVTLQYTIQIESRPVPGQPFPFAP